MNAQTIPTTEQRADVDYAARFLDIEDKINGLARLGFTIELMTKSFLKELDLYSEHGISTTEFRQLTGQKREVVYDLVEEVEVQTRELREAYYEGEKGEGAPAILPLEYSASASS